MALWTKTPLRHLLYLRQSTKSGLSTKGNAGLMDIYTILSNTPTHTMESVKNKYFTNYESHFCDEYFNNRHILLTKIAGYFCRQSTKSGLSTKVKA